jgi:hypothetical protein
LVEKNYFDLEHENWFVWSRKNGCYVSYVVYDDNEIEKLTGEKNSWK